MRTIRITCAAIVTMAAQVVQAQASRPIVLHLHKAGDTVSIRNATVVVDHVIEAGKTDANGKVKIDDLEDGGHIIEAEAPGYQGIFDNFVSGPGARSLVEIEMRADERKAEVLKGPKTGLDLAGLEARRLKGGGLFFTRAQLDAANGRPLPNVLQVDMKAKLVTERGGDVLVSAEPKAGGGACYSTIVRDGIRVYPADDALPPTLSRFFAEQLAGLEFYPKAATAPAELKDSAGCGALVIWSRSAGKT